MLTKEEILKEVRSKGVIRSSDFVARFGVSRQYVTRLLSTLVDEKKLVKIGSTRSAVYTTDDYIQKNPDITPTVYSKTLKNEGLEEHRVLVEVEQNLLNTKDIPENIKSIFQYAFLEMLNNAIDHSTSKKIKVFVRINDGNLVFTIDDFGVGVFRSIMNKRKLDSEIEAIQDLLKGKTTTAPKLHSGEGIFFTSKAGDEFILESFGHELVVNNTIKDLFVKEVRGQKQGTKVTFRINLKDKHHLNDIFKKYTDIDGGGYGFDKTEIQVRLYMIGGVHISRSQARRVLSGLEKFEVITMDYDKVPTVGQAFADEIYRVYKNKRPDITIQNINMNEAVRFMVERAKTEAEKEKQR